MSSKSLSAFVSFFIFFVLLFLVYIHQTDAAIKNNYISSFGSKTTPITIPNVKVSGSNRLLMVGISIVNDGATGARVINSVVFNGSESLTAVPNCNANDTDDARTWIYYLTAPSVTTADVVITLDGNVVSILVGGAITFTGVDQTTPLGTCATDVNGADATTSVTVTSGVGEVVFDVVAAEANEPKVGSGQIQQWGIAAWGKGSIEGGAASVVMSWTVTAHNHEAMSAVSIKPAKVPTQFIRGGVKVRGQVKFR